MDKYCDKDWSKCPYAKGLNKLYESYVEGEIMGNKIKELSHKNVELEKELRKTSSMLGRSNKREAEKDKQIAELRKKNRYLEDKYMEMRDQLRSAEEKEQVISTEVQYWMSFYNGILCYLIDNIGGTLDRAVVEEWLSSHEYKLTADTEEVIDEFGEKQPKIIRYKAEVREIADRPEGPASEDEGAGGEEAGGAGCEVEGKDIEAEEVQE
ncbi:MAG: hypothetical protein Q4B18_07900 [Bacillota bacterium]|nr:hypothetical protein [Bacillota bacterium]